MYSERRKQDKLRHKKNPSCDGGLGRKSIGNSCYLSDVYGSVLLYLKRVKQPTYVNQF
jgi:uncharacterized UBP type Zn finger protein